MRIDWSQQLPDGSSLQDWLASHYATLTNQDLERELSVLIGHPVKRGTIATKAWRMGLGKPEEVISEALAARYEKVPESRQPRYDAPPKVTGDVVVLSDPHAPFVAAEFVDKVIELAVTWKVTQCIISGDTIDVNAFSPYGRDAQMLAEAEFQQAEEFINAIAKNFNKVLLLMGNHEDRLRRLVNKELAVSRLLRMLTRAENVEISEYYFCTVDDKWMIGHPQNASVIPGRVPQMLCEKYMLNVAMGHGHLWGMSTDRSGRFLAIDTGICADPKRMGYTTLRPNTRPLMVQGALLLRRGYPWLLHPQFTDFNALQSIR